MTTMVEPIAQQLDVDNPWPGLGAFSEDGHRFFHGRAIEEAELLSRVKRDMLTVLYGQSGLGKTSLLNAGLFPRLRLEDYLPVYVRLTYASGSPPLMQQIWSRLLEECSAHAVEAPSRAAAPDLWEYLHLGNTAFWTARSRVVTPVLVLDQFEELFTLGRERLDDARIVQFVSGLGDLVSNRPLERVLARLAAAPDEPSPYSFRRDNYRFLLSLREDYLPDLETLQERMRTTTGNRFRLTHMTPPQALESVRKTGGDLVEAPVARAIVAFTMGIKPGELPDDAPLPDRDVEPALLSVFCRELNEKRHLRHQDRIELDLLSGSQEEILLGFYERSLDGVHPGMRRFIEERLLTETGHRDSRALEEALREPGVTPAGIDALVERRLLRREERFRVMRVELTHDVLTKVVKDSRTRRRLDEERAALIALQEATAEKARERSAAALAELRRAEKLWEDFKATGNQQREDWRFARLADIESVLVDALALDAELGAATSLLAAVRRLFAETGIKTKDLNLAAIYLQKFKNMGVGGETAVQNLASELAAAWDEVDPRKNKYVRQARKWALAGCWVPFLWLILALVIVGVWHESTVTAEWLLITAVVTTILHFALALFAVMESAGEQHTTALNLIGFLGLVGSIVGLNLLSFIFNFRVLQCVGRARMTRILWSKNAL